MDGIEGVSGIPGGPGNWSRLAAAAAAAPVAPATAAGRASGTRASGPGRELAAAAEAPIRASQFGGDGRFEKLILAVQALRFDVGPREARTARIEEMRRAAEELFSIDGVPELMRPSPAPEPPPAATTAGAQPSAEPGTEPEQAPETARPPETPALAGDPPSHPAPAAAPPPD